MYLDITTGIKAVHLVEQLQHGALDLALSARLRLIALGANGVNLICSDSLPSALQALLPHVSTIRIGHLQDSSASSLALKSVSGAAACMEAGQPGRLPRQLGFSFEMASNNDQHKMLQACWLTHL